FPTVGDGSISMCPDRASTRRCSRAASTRCLQRRIRSGRGGSPTPSSPPSPSSSAPCRSSRRTVWGRFASSKSQAAICSPATAREDYDRGHIPGAVFFDIDEIAEPGTSLPHMIPSLELFARKMEQLGIGDDDRVIVYDSAGLSSAGRAWWMLRLFGHHNVALLDGGLPKWKAEGRPLETAVPNPPRRRFSARFDPALVRDKQALLGNLSARREQVLDARAAGRFEGNVEETRPGLRRGHIPGSQIGRASCRERVA